MRRCLFLYLFCILSTITLSAQKIDLEGALKQLDDVVAHRDVYIQNRQRVIDDLKKSLSTTSFDADRYVICKRLYDEYQKFDSDSALVYAFRCSILAKKVNQNDLILQSKINVLSILTFRGEYMNAKNLLSDIGPIDRIPQSFRAPLAIASLDFYARVHQQVPAAPFDSKTLNMNECWQLFSSYLPADNWIRYYYQGLIFHTTSSDKLLSALKNVPNPSVQAAMIEISLAVNYKQQGKTNLYYYYLVKSAINDISMANREAQSLLYLIESPYVKADSKRAFDYAMVCSENAKAYKDTGRSLDIVAAHATITKAFQARLERKTTYMAIGMILLAIALTVIIVQLFLLHSKRRRNEEIMSKLEKANEQQLKLISTGEKMQEQLQDANRRMLDELKYRNANFLNVYLLVSRYITDMQKFKKGVYNYIITGKIDQAKKALNSSASADEYLQDFYKQFDKAFLSTHPDFVERLNILLREDKKMSLPMPDTLTPELRIYALVSLGITDSVSIADFLHYSTQTIYNYRLKMRRNSCIPEKDFADTVAKMYY